MSGADEEWVKAAMSDDAMVVQVLVHLNRSSTPPPLRVKRPAALPRDWSVRQRRSKAVSVNNNPKKPAHRASPTTPLSLSGNTSISGGSGGAIGGGFEESSEPPPFKLPNTTRSKINGDSEKTPCKGLRKKKTLAQLKEEENSLVKERRELNREITALRVNLEKQRATNESLKRMKLELIPHSNILTSVQEEYVSDPRIEGNNVTLQSSTLKGCLVEQNMDAASTPKFVLPDLNMPFENSSIPETATP